MTVCYPTMEQQSTQARYERLRAERGEWHDGTFTKWAKEPSRDFPVHHSHGTTIWVSEVDHGFGGDFLSSGSQERVDEQSEAEEGQ